MKFDLKELQIIKSALYHRGMFVQVAIGCKDYCDNNDRDRLVDELIKIDSITQTIDETIHNIICNK